MELEVLEWLMQPDPCGSELPDLADLIQRPEWMARGACRGTDRSHYFPARGASAELARSVCSTCPVHTECFDYAMDDPDLAGIWGGTTTRERMMLRQGVA